MLYHLPSVFHKLFHGFVSYFSFPLPSAVVISPASSSAHSSFYTVSYFTSPYLDFSVSVFPSPSAVVMFSSVLFARSPSPSCLLYLTSPFLQCSVCLLSFIVCSCYVLKCSLCTFSHSLSPPFNKPFFGMFSMSPPFLHRLQILYSPVFSLHILPHPWSPSALRQWLGFFSSPSKAHSHNPEQKRGKRGKIDHKSSITVQLSAGINLFPSVEKRFVF